MCELKVVIAETVVFENVVYAKTVENSVVVKDILGNSKTFKNHAIAVVNVAKEQLVLFPINTKD